MTDWDAEIERILETVQENCAISGGYTIFKNDNYLSCVMGDEEICWITQEDGRDENKVREKIRGALQ